MTKSTRIGDLGEEIAVKYLRNKGYLVIERNFRRKYGEIDIICKKEGNLHFIEVKSVSRITLTEEHEFDDHRPEDNLHGNKAKRLRRVVEAYMLANPTSGDFYVHLVTVKLDPLNHIAKVAMIEDLII